MTGLGVKELLLFATRSFLQATGKMDSEVIPSLCEGDCLQIYSLDDVTFDQIEGKPTQ